METQSTNTTWTDICSINDLTPNAGICALFNEQQVASLMGSTEETVYVASPLYKQRFNLVTGECLDSDKEEHKLKTFAIRIENEQVQLKEAS